MNPRHCKSIWSDNHSGEEDSLTLFYVSLTAGHILHELILIAVKKKKKKRGA